MFDGKKERLSVWAIGYEAETTNPRGERSICSEQ
jgi:hypothetical protein